MVAPSSTPLDEEGKLPAQVICRYQGTFPTVPARQVGLRARRLPQQRGAAERGRTGMREAVLVAQLGFDGWVLPHPYAPEVRGRLPFHKGDDPRYDAQFADHPLSRVRAWAHHVVRTARVDPGFAALPPFSKNPRTACGSMAPRTKPP